MLIFVPHIDRKAALLAGFELGERPSFEAAPADFGDDWPCVVEALRLDRDGTATFKHTVAAPTPAAVIAAARAEADRVANDAIKARADIEAAIVEYYRLLDAPFSQFPAVTWKVHENLGVDAYGYWGPWLGDITGVRVPYIQLYPATSYLRDEPCVAEVEALQQRLEARVKAENARRADEARPRLQAEMEAAREARRAKAAADEAAKAALIAERAQKRLQSGYWERETASYSTRREGKPWCARVTGVDSRGKLVYEWGEWSGRPGEAGLLRAACKPGEIIAWGQKDLRRSDRGEHRILRMQDDGTMAELSAAEAAKALRS